MQNIKEFLLSNETRKAYLQSTPDSSNLQGESKKFRVIGSTKKIAVSKEKKKSLPHSERFNHI